MEAIDFNKVLFRCSGLSTIMTNLESTVLTKGHITECKKIHRQLTTDRTPQYGSKYIDKGLMQEELAITLLARVKKKMLRKNKERINNLFLTGLPDLYLGPNIRSAEEGYDTKCSWDVHTFPYFGDKLDSNYEFQNHGYMWLTGAKKWTTAYCLVNAPGSMILAEKQRVWYRLGCPDQADRSYEEYVDECIKIEKNMIFNMEEFRRDNPNFDLEIQNWHHDIPLEQRVMEFEVQRDDAVLEKVAARVVLCRKQMVEYDNALKLINR